ncbi:MAG: dihydroorotate dehydrogenase [Chloroflexi bacterium]|nr:dihydroorotate dehydrogenase [Chloroflexota bacterium]
MALDLSVNLAPRHPRGLPLRNPVMTASGTCGYGLELAEAMDVQRLGAIVSKGTTLHPRSGNPQPRLAETASGLLNSIGLENIGVEAVVRDKAPAWAKWQVPVIVNIAGETVAEYAAIARRLEGVAGVAALEVNVSCPNVETGGLEFGTSPSASAQVTEAVRRATTLPIIVKLTPNVTDILEVARAAEEAGADALTLVNTLRGMAIDRANRRPFLGAITGGLSGPAIKPVALYMVYRVAGALDIPVIGCGGIASAEDALEFFMAGARAIQVGTATLINPGAPLEVLEGIEHLLEAQGLSSLSEITGAALPKRG